MSDDAVHDGLASRGTSHGRPVEAPLALPLDYEAFYLGHQEFFHAFAEIHLGSRRTAESVVHEVFLEILAGWEPLLQEGDLEQRTLAVLSRHVTRRLAQEGREPAFVINGPIARTLRAVRSEMEIAQDSSGLYEAITELPTRQFNVIVLRHLMGYETKRIARFMGLDPRTVDYHGRKGRERLRGQLTGTGRGRTAGDGTTKNRKGTEQ
ncbi:sigma-70 family RNA polymerase sigma factor [Streptomyces niveus]|uniref:sigma-70 family RNA polymerase sigma factor n=1 Tax=Streptomyces niveus TaxID=193462 RepID=UPI000AF471E3|nr:sigma-70 family RNA polymerase sigma factor [Streptomyces niveus]